MYNNEDNKQVNNNELNQIYQLIPNTDTYRLNGLSINHPVHKPDDWGVLITQAEYDSDKQNYYRVSDSRYKKT